MCAAACGQSFSTATPAVGDGGGAAGSQGSGGKANGGSLGTGGARPSGGGGSVGTGGAKVPGAGGSGQSGGASTDASMPPTGSGGTIAVDASVPSNVPTDGLLLWLRADLGVTVQSGFVTRWDDQSPAHARATQDLSGLEPTFVASGTNGLPSVRFDGNDDFLQIASGFSDFSKGVALFGVFQSETTNACTAMFEASNGSEIDDLSFGQDHTQFNYEVFNSSDANVVYPSGVPVLFSVVHHADETYEIRRNGLFAVNGQFPLPTTIERQAVYVGKTLYMGCPSFNGTISELFVYARELASAEVSAVETYLQKKYACCSQ